MLARLVTLLSDALRGKPCIALSSDVRVRVRAADRASYPDVLVVCGQIERDPDDDQAVVNPTVIVEMLSANTEAVDRDEKLADYRRLPALREYVLVSQRERRVELYQKAGPRRWSLRELGPTDELALESLEVALAVDAIYANALGAFVSEPT